MIPPSVGGFDPPLIHVPINAEWIDILIGFCVDTLLKESTWEGTESEIDDALNKVDDLVLALMSGYSRVGMIEWHVLDTLPAGMHVLDGSLINRVDYPTFYEKVDPRFHLDADTVQLPDWRGRFIKIEGAGESLGDMDGSNTKAIGITNLPAHHHAASTGLPGSGFFAGQSNGGGQSPKSQFNTSSTATDTRATAFANTADTGGGTPIDIQPSYAVLGAAIWLW